MPASNSFRAGRLDDLAVHPTVKPVALVADAMRDCSRRGDIVLDPFMGSGTTIWPPSASVDVLTASRSIPSMSTSRSVDGRPTRGGTPFSRAPARPSTRSPRSAARPGGAMIKRIRRHARAPQQGWAAIQLGRELHASAMADPRKQHQFQPGQSGNRKGRPKGAKNTATLLREILDRKIEVRTGSTVRKISVREAMLTRFAEFALKGDTKSAAFLLQRYDMAETAQEHANSATTLEEQEIIDAYPEDISQEWRQKEMTHLEQAFHDAILRTDFESFLRRCLMTLNPGSPYLPNWHICRDRLSAGTDSAR